MRVYLDAEVEIGSATAGQPAPVNDYSFDIGGFFSSGGGVSEQHFDGVTDEVSVHKAALSTDEVRKIYGHGSRGKCK